MISALTQEVISNRGWTFIPSHDALTGKNFDIPIAVPDRWVHDNHGTAWDVDQVLSFINDEIELEIERDLR